MGPEATSAAPDAYFEGGYIISVVSTAISVLIAGPTSYSAGRAACALGLSAR
ncbi:MAG: hypothetical protein R3C16_05040 [Hyphomonadaceae bacterium]